MTQTTVTADSSGWRDALAARLAARVAQVALVALAASGLVTTPARAAPVPAPSCPTTAPALNAAAGAAESAVPADRAAAAEGGAGAAVSPAEASVGRLYMADGQLVSWDLRVFVTAEPPPGQVPTLCLLAGHAVTEATPGEKRGMPARLVARRQQWIGGQAEDGAATQHVGTMLLFSVARDMVPWWKPMMRVRPLLLWTGADGQPVAVLGPREVNIGNAPTAWTMTIALVLAFVVGIVLLARRVQAPAGFLVADDGHLSLSRCQMALWTLVIGGVVFFFGIVQLDVPEIPASLVVLMGMSLATTGVSARAEAAGGGAAPAGAGGAEPAEPAAPPVATTRAASQVHWRWTDLISGDNGWAKGPGLSLARAQMLFWTLLLVIIFVSKSVLSGVLWAIPWELIALMGISQAGYLAPKLK